MENLLKIANIYNFVLENIKSGNCQECNKKSDLLPLGLNDKYICTKCVSNDKDFNKRFYRKIKDFTDISIKEFISKNNIELTEIQNISGYSISKINRFINEQDKPSTLFIDTLKIIISENLNKKINKRSFINEVFA